MRRFPDFLFIPEKFSAWCKGPVPEFSRNASTASWNIRDVSTLPENASVVIFAHLLLFGLLAVQPCLDERGVNVDGSATQLDAGLPRPALGLRC